MCMLRLAARRLDKAAPPNIFYNMCVLTTKSSSLDIRMCWMLTS